MKFEKQNELLEKIITFILTIFNRRIKCVNRKVCRKSNMDINLKSRKDNTQIVVDIKFYKPPMDNEMDFHF